MRLLGLLCLVMLAAFAVAFAVANRSLVTLSLDPLPFAFDLPLYLALMLALILGILIGGVASKISSWRSARRQRAQSFDPAETRKTSPAPAGTLLPPPVI